MMNSVLPLRRLAVVSAILALGACGGSGGSGTTTSLQAFEAQVDADQEVLVRVLGVANGPNPQPGIAGTLWAEMPMDGTARFDGFGAGTIILDAATVDEIAVRGDARVNVDFETGNITGAITNISAANTVEAFDVTGSVDLTAGRIGIIRPNDLEIDYAGDLNIDQTTYVLNGTMDGDFRGTRTRATVRPVTKALQAFDNRATVTAGADTYDAQFYIIAEND